MNKLLAILAKGEMSQKLRTWMELGILGDLMPEIFNCVGVEGGKHHDETVFEHLLMALEAAEDANYHPLLQLAVLLHDVGKPLVAKKDKDGNTSFHSHEVKGASIAYKLCKRFKLGDENAKYVVKLVRHHMFRFDSQTKEKAIRKWLFKVGKDVWEDLFLLRAADRMGNEANRDKPIFTRQMKELDKKIRDLISSNTVIFKEDIAVPEPVIKNMIGNKYDLNEVYSNLIGLVNHDLTRNKPEWLIDYIKRVYP